MAQIKSRKCNLPMPMRNDGTAVFINDEATQTVNPTAGDTLDFKIPKGFELSYLRIRMPDMDASTGMQGRIGFAPIVGTNVIANGVSLTEDDDYFQAQGALGQAAAVLDIDVTPTVFEDDVYLRITWNVAASGTFTAGKVMVTMGGNQVGVR